MHKATLMKQQSTDAETNDTSYLIENGALKELLDFDVVTPEQWGKDQKNRLTKSYNSIGTRILNRKQAIKKEFLEYLNVEDANVPILSRQELERRRERGNASEYLLSTTGNRNVS